VPTLRWRARVAAGSRRISLIGRDHLVRPMRAIKLSRMIQHIKSDRRQRIPLAALAVVTCTAVTACSASVAHSAAPAAEAARNRPAACAVAVPEIAALWRPADNGVSGYGDVPTLAQPADLYQTAWSLLVARAAHLATTAVKPSLVIPELQSVLRRHGSSSVETANISTLDQLYLSAEALLALGARPAPALRKAVSALRDGGQYRPAPKAPPSWGWTYLAVQTLRDAGIDVPAVVRKSLAAALPQARSARTISAITQTGLPVIASLALLEPARALRRGALLPSRLLRRWESLIVSQQPSGPGLGFLLAMRRIAVAEGTHFLEVPTRWYDSLRVNGYYSFGPGAASGDPQVTYDAVALGAPVSAGTSATLALGEMPQGWITIISPPSILTTFDAVFANSLCGVTAHRLAMSEQVALWLAEAGQTGLGSPGSLTADDIGRLCWMASTYGVSIIAAQRNEIANILRNAILAALQLSGQPGASAIGNDLRDAASCNMKVDRALGRRIVAYLAHGKIPTLSAAFGLYSAARALGDPAQVSRARDAASRLRVDGGYEMSAQNGFPNIISTCYGYEIVGWPSAEARSRGLATYQTRWGTAFVPRSVKLPNGSSEPTIELASLAFGLAVAAGHQPPVPLI
jgi:hypothetical protein